MAKKIMCILLTLTLIALTGCGAKDAEKAVSSEKKANKVKQEKMADEELARTLERIEYSALISALNADSYLSEWHHQAYIGDADGDGTQELVYGNDLSALLFNEDDAKAYTIFGQGGEFLTDDNGIFYATCIFTGPEYSGNEEIGWSSCNRYECWNGSEFVTAYRECNIDYYDESKSDLDYWLHGDVDEELTQDELDALNFAPAGTKPNELTSYSFDARFREHVTEVLTEKLTQRYPYSTCVQKDINGDGKEETLITIPEILLPWTQSLADDNPVWTEQSYQLKYNITDMERGHTALLVISTQGETTTVTSYGISENIMYDASDIEFYNNYFILGGYTSYIPSDNLTLSSLSENDRKAVLTAINNHFISRGYVNVIYKTADVSDLPGEEILCFVQQEHGLYVYVISLSGNSITLISKENIDIYSYYLTEYNNKTHIFTYRQSATNEADPTYSYYYSIYRFDSNNQKAYADEQSISYKASESDATNVSSFFKLMNAYFEQKIIVLHDVYLLMGSEWMSNDQVDLGTPPQNNTSTESGTEEGQLGFVQVYPDSWLHLRVGPGTQYDKVLLDPNNPDSFIRQALGTPVTILEEIETDDPENPVWVKIRIYYDSTEFIGYSSKKYIRMANE